VDHQFESFFHRKYRVIQHILFWIVYIIFYLALTRFYVSRLPILDQLLSLIITVSVDIAASYLTVYYLLPRLLFRRKYIAFIIAFLFSGTAFVFLQRAIVYYIKIPVLLPELEGTVDFFDFNPLFAFLNIYTIVAFMAAIRFMKKWYKDQLDKQHLEQQNLQSELALLRSQVNPHFLFNTLNNIDSLVKSDQQKASDSIIRLSDIMRYMLYEANTEKVQLDDELEYLKSYISLHKLRLKDPDFIEFEIHGNTAGKMIPPMLFIPFVENAFKHGNKKVASPGIMIRINVKKEEISFYISNYKSVSLRTSDTNSGIGLANVQRRLELLYGSANYDLTINENEDMFKVQLMVKL